MRYAIGIDIGGTTVASGILDEEGELIRQEVVSSDVSGRERMFARVVECVDNLLAGSGIPFDEIMGIGVGVPGKVDPHNGVAIFQNNLPWENFPLAERLRTAIGIDRVVVDNDVYMATFAEWKKAGLANNELFVYVTVSTGISCAIIQNGEFLRGAGFAGELGLIPVVRDVRADEAGSTEGKPAEVGAHHDNFSEKQARLENVAAGPAMEKAANQRFHTTDMTGEALFAKFNEGDERAVALIEQMADSIAQGVYMLTSMIDPHKIVFGGSIAFYNPKLVHLIREKLEWYVIDEQRHILDNLDVSKMENGQGIIGAGLRVVDRR